MTVAAGGSRRRGTLSLPLLELSSSTNVDNPSLLVLAVLPPSLCPPMMVGCQFVPCCVMSFTFVGHHAIVGNFVAGCRLLTTTFACCCHVTLVPAAHCLYHSCRWLVVAFSTCPAAYQLNHQAENIFMFPHLDLF